MGGLNKVVRTGEVRGLSECPYTTTPGLVADALFTTFSGEPLFLRITWDASYGGKAHYLIPYSVLHTAPRGFSAVLARYGIDAGPHNIGDILKWCIREAAAAKRYIMGSIDSTTPYGWIGGDKYSFPGGVVAPDGNISRRSPLENTLDQTSYYAYPSDDEHANGGLKDWIQAVNKACEGRPRVAAALYAAVAPALLKVLGASGFSILFVGPACVGKTTVLRMAASVWSNPDTFIHNWSDSPPLSETPGVPILYDDAVMPSTSLIARTLDRGARLGAVMLGACRVPLNEAERVKLDNPRSLTLWGIPFGKQDNTSAEAVIDLNAAVSHNYGLFGPEFVSRLIQARGAFSRLYEKHNDTTKKFIVTAGRMGGVTSALAGVVATIYTSGQIVHSLFPEFDLFSPESIARELWDWLKATSGTESLAVMAHHIIKSFIESNAHRLFNASYQNEYSKKQPPSGGWIGLTSKDSTQFVWIAKRVIDDLLLDSGINPGSVYKEMLVTGMLRPTNGKLMGLKEVAGRMTPCICVNLL